MTIRYQVVENPLREGEFFPRIVSGGTVQMTETIGAIVRETGVSDTDVKAVLNALLGQVRLALLDGRNISISGIGTFSLSLGEKLPSSDAEVTDAVEVRVNLRVDPALVAAIRKDATFERVVKGERSPLPTGFHDIASGEIDRYTAGNIGEIVGDEMEFNADRSDEGVFFIAEDGSEVRVTSYAQTGARRILFLIPPGLSGAQAVEIRTRYETNRLRISRYRKTLQPA